MDNKVNLDKDAINDDGVSLDEQKEAQIVLTETSTQEFCPNMTYVPDDNAEKTFAVIAIICGSLSILTSCFMVIPFVFAAVGIVMAIIQLKERKSWHNLAQVGLWLSIGGTGATILLKIFAAVISSFGFFSAFLE